MTKSNNVKADRPCSRDSILIIILFSGQATASFAVMTRTSGQRPGCFSLYRSPSPNSQLLNVQLALFFAELLKSQYAIRP